MQPALALGQGAVPTLLRKPAPQRQSRSASLCRHPLLTNSVQLRSPSALKCQAGTVLEYARIHLSPLMTCPRVLVLSRLDPKLWRAEGSPGRSSRSGEGPPPWAGAGCPLTLGSSRQCHALPSSLQQDSGLPGRGGCLPHHRVPAPGPNPRLRFPSPADVTSPGGEPGWKKEPPSGFREPDLSPGKPDSERYRNHAAATTTTPTIAVTRTILNPET